MRPRLWRLASGNVLARVPSYSTDCRSTFNYYYCYHGVLYGGKPVRYCWRGYRIDNDDIGRAYYDGKPGFTFGNLDRSLLRLLRQLR